MGMVVVAFWPLRRRVATVTDQINLKTDQSRRKLRQAIQFLLGKPILDGDILFLQSSRACAALGGMLHRGPRYTGSECLIQANLCGRFFRLLRIDETAKRKEHERKE